MGRSSAEFPLPGPPSERNVSIQVKNVKTNGPWRGLDEERSRPCARRKEVGFRRRAWPPQAVGDVDPRVAPARERISERQGARQRLERGDERLRCAVTVPRELHGSHPVEATVDEGPHRLDEVEIALSEGEVLVHAGRAVGHVHVDQPIREAIDDGPHGQVRRDGAVTEIEGHAEVAPRMPHALDEGREAGRPLHEHPRLGLEGDAHPRPARVAQDGRQPLREAIAQGVVGLLVEGPTDPLRRGAGPERHDARVEVRCHVDAAPVEVDAALPGGRCLVHQVRPVLRAWVEHETRAGLDRRLEAEIVEERTHAVDLTDVRAHGVERPDVGCDRDGLEAGLRHQHEGLLEPVEREAVRVVAEAEGRGHDARSPSSSGASASGSASIAGA